MKKYSSEQNVQYLVALLKAYNIKKVVASPGTTNLSFVASLQCDPFFEIYSCVDERSAAYMAVGMSEESGEPVVITCTGATASRNYMSALTEAYYRKLPILAVTGTQDENRIGQLSSQLIDRSTPPKDVVVFSTHILAIKNDDDIYFTQLKLNQALSALHRRGGGPVHINLQTVYSRDFSVDRLPEVRTIKRISYRDIEQMPMLPNGRIGIFVGSHADFSESLTKAIDDFCASHDAVVFCDLTSGYYGEYRYSYSLPGSQKEAAYPVIAQLDLCIHIGEISAEYGSLGKLRRKEVWRVSEDGEMRDQFRAMTHIFEMAEEDFFNYYKMEGGERRNNYLVACRSLYDRLYSQIPELPLSNVWLAYKMHDKIPAGSVVHFGILNSIRSWNLFNLPPTVRSYGNVGGFGIDGCMSSMIGASLIRPKKLFFGIFGDLSFFYDMNAVGNRHIGNNVRILLVNNGRGQEFRNFYHTGSTFGEDADKYIAAAGHFGNMSRSIVKHYAEDLGYEYLCASSKEEFLAVYEHFLIPEMTDRPMLFEVFTGTKEESDALLSLWSIDKNTTDVAIGKVVKVLGGEIGVKKILGKKGIAFFRKLLRR